MSGNKIAPKLDMIRAFFGIAVVTVLALSPAAAQQTLPDDNHLIVPGQRVGAIKLGAARWKDLNAVLTLSDMSDVRKGTVEVLWSSRDPKPATFATILTAECGKVSTQDKCRVLEILVAGSPEYATAEGLHIGVPEKQVRDILGEPNRSDRLSQPPYFLTLMYSSGISFSMSDETGEYRVETISVRPPNCLKDVPCT